MRLVVQPHEAVNSCVLKFSACLLLLIVYCEQGNQGPPLFHRLEDFNVAHIVLTGHDPVSDDPAFARENIIIRLFLAAARQADGLVEIKGTLQRESLDHELDFKPPGYEHHMYTCLKHKWNPSITLLSKATNNGHPLLFMDQNPGIPNYISLCLTDERVNDQIMMPYYIHGILPADASDDIFELRFHGWKHYAIYKPELQMAVPMDPQMPEVWNVMKAPYGKEIQTWATLFVRKVEYETELVGYSGHMLFCTVEVVMQLLMLPSIVGLINLGRLKLVLWERMTECEGVRRCYGDARYDRRKPVAYQPLMFTVAGLIYWNAGVYLSYTDVDEYLLLDKPGMTLPDLITDPECFNSKPFISVPTHNMETETAMPEARHYTWWARNSTKSNLSSYVYRKTLEMSNKSILRASELVAYSVHEPMWQHRADDHIFGSVVTKKQATCAILAHFTNLFVFRDKRPDNATMARDWLRTDTFKWVFDQPDAIS